MLKSFTLSVCTLLLFLSFQAEARSGFNLYMPNGYNVPCPANAIACLSNNTCLAVGHQVVFANGTTVQYCGGNNDDALTYGAAFGQNSFGVPWNIFGWTFDECVNDTDGDGLYAGQELGDPLCVWNATNLVALRSNLIYHPGDSSSNNSAMAQTGCFKRSYLNGTVPGSIASLRSSAAATSGALTWAAPGVLDVCTNGYYLAWNYTQVVSNNTQVGNVTRQQNYTQLVYGSAGVFPTDYSTTRSYTIFNLPLATTVSYNITPANEWGNGNTTYGSFVTLSASVPRQPGSVSVSVSAGTTTASVIWTAPLETGGVKILSYTLILTNLTGTYYNTTGGNNTLFVYNNLKAARTYHFRMMATNAVGSSPLTPYITFSTSVTGVAPHVYASVVLTALMLVVSVFANSGAGWNGGL